MQRFSSMALGPSLVAFYMFILTVSPVHPQASAVELRRPAAANAAQLQTFPDYLNIRSEFLSAVVTAAPANALRFAPAIRNSPHGRVRVSVEREGAVFYVLFLLERDGGFPHSGRGNIIIRRAADTGFIQQIKWMLSDDGRSYLRLTANNERTIVDYVVGGSLVNSGVSVNSLIYYFLIQPFSHLHSQLQARINWQLVFNQPDQTPGGVSLLEAFNAAASGRLEEYSGLVFNQAAGLADPREHGPVLNLPAWQPDFGYPLHLLRTILNFEVGTLFAADLRLGSGSAPQRLLLVPTRPGPGLYQLLAWDLASRTAVDLEELIAAKPEASLRLYRLPTAGH